MVEQSGPEHLRGEGQRGVVGREVQRGRRDQPPQPLDQRVALPVAAQEPAEALPVQRGVGAGQHAQRERAPRRADAVQRAQHAVGGERRRQVRRRRDAGRAAQVRRPRSGRQHRNVQVRLQRGAGGRVDALEQPPVGAAAAQEDVLAVVDRELAAAERERGTAQARASLEQRHRATRLGAAGAQPRCRPVPRRRRPCARARCRRRRGGRRRPPCLAHRTPRPSSAPPATRSLSRVGSDSAPAHHQRRVGGDALQQLAVDAGHRRAACARCAGRGPSSSSQAAVVATPRPGGLEADQLGQRAVLGVEVAVGQHPDVAAEQGEVLLGQVDAADAVVLAHVAQDVGQLQRDAEIVGDSGVLGEPVGARVRAKSGAKTPKRQPADRARHAPAVGHEVVEGVVRPARARPSRSRRRARRRRRAGWAAGARRRRARGATGSSGWRSGAVAAARASGEQLALAPGGQVAVADVVDPPCHRVDRRQRGALGFGQQPDAPGEVARLLAGDAFALGVGSGDLGRRRCARRAHRGLVTSNRPACASVARLPGVTSRASTSKCAAAQGVGGGQAAGDVAGDGDARPARQAGDERCALRAAVAPARSA